MNQIIFVNDINKYPLVFVLDFQHKEHEVIMKFTGPITAEIYDGDILNPQYIIVDQGTWCEVLKVNRRVYNYDVSEVGEETYDLEFDILSQNVEPKVSGVKMADSLLKLSNRDKRIDKVLK